MFHADCVPCCQADRCHFCLYPARHTLEDGAHSYRCCTAHLAWLGNHDYAPGANATPSRGRSVKVPLHEIPEAMMARQPDMGSTGARILGDLLPPVHLR